MVNAVANPSVAMIPTSLPPCSNASGIIVFASMVRIAPAAKVSTKATTSGLTKSGWARSRILWMWVGITLVSGVASAAGYGLFQDSSPEVVAFVLTFAAGAILTMLANTMMPEAFEHGGKLVGIMVTLGFATAFTIHLLD